MFIVSLTLLHLNLLKPWLEVVLSGLHCMVRIASVYSSSLRVVLYLKIVFPHLVHNRMVVGKAG
jgi:hypothetical protein